MVLAFFDYHVDEGTLVRLLDTDDSGTIFANLARIEHLGFRVAIGPGSPADLLAVTGRGVPLITAVYTAHLPTYPLPPWAPHCVVVAGATRSRVAIYDPDPHRNAGPDLVPFPRFVAAWRARDYRMAS